MTEQQKGFLNLHTSFGGIHFGVPIFTSPFLTVKMHRPMPDWVYLNWLPNIKYSRKFRAWFVNRRRIKWLKNPNNTYHKPSRNILVLPNDQGIVMHPEFKAYFLNHATLPGGFFK